MLKLTVKSVLPILSVNKYQHQHHTKLSNYWQPWLQYPRAFSSPSHLHTWSWSWESGSFLTTKAFNHWCYCCLSPFQNDMEELDIYLRFQVIVSKVDCWKTLKCSHHCLVQKHSLHFCFKWNWGMSQDCKTTQTAVLYERILKMPASLHLPNINIYDVDLSLSSELCI